MQGGEEAAAEQQQRAAGGAAKKEQRKRERAAQKAAQQEAEVEEARRRAELELLLLDEQGLQRGATAASPGESSLPWSYMPGYSKIALDGWILLMAHSLCSCTSPAKRQGVILHMACLAEGCQVRCFPGVLEVSAANA